MLCRNGHGGKGPLLVDQCGDQEVSLELGEDLMNGILIPKLQTSIGWAAALGLVFESGAPERLLKCTPL